MVVKYRRRVINDEISVRGRGIFEYIAPGYGITLEPELLSAYGRGSTDRGDSAIYRESGEEG
jgi:hypothetical protein